MIVILAGNHDQFRYWVRRNIIPVTSKADLQRLQGIAVDEVYREGTWLDWVDNEVEDTISMRMGRHKKGA